MPSDLIYEPDDITLVLTTEEGTERVTIPLDFSDFTDEESARAMQLSAGSADVATAMSAFLFVAAARQVDLDDEAFDGFAAEMERLWDHDPTILEEMQEA